MGKPLARPELAEATRQRFEDNLRTAQVELDANPDSAEALIWVGRRLGYLARYREAIEAFSEGVERFPDDARFLRHRGHRYLSIRRLADAEADLGLAHSMIQGSDDQIEPDGLPNAAGIPTSTLHSNIRYHLGLAHYLQGEFNQALPHYRRDVEVAGNPDMRIASTYWLYLTLRRLGDDQGAAEVIDAVPTGLELIENHDYYRLLLVFRGDLEPADLRAEGTDELALHNATVGYGLAVFELVEGRAAEATRRFEEIVSGPQWAAFGYLAAEAELARLRGAGDAG